MTQDNVPNHGNPALVSFLTAGTNYLTYTMYRRKYFLWLVVCEISVPGWLAGSKLEISWQKGMEEESCLTHGGQKQ